MMKTTSKEIAEGLSNITTEFSKTLSSFDIQATTEILEMLVGVSFSDLEIDEVSSVCVCVCVRACARVHTRVPALASCGTIVMISDGLF